MGATALMHCLVATHSHCHHRPSPLFGSSGRGGQGRSRGGGSGGGQGEGGQGGSCFEGDAVIASALQEEQEMAPARLVSV